MYVNSDDVVTLTADSIENTLLCEVCDALIADLHKFTDSEPNKTALINQLTELIDHAVKEGCDERIIHEVRLCRSNLLTDCSYSATWTALLRLVIPSLIIGGKSQVVGEGIKLQCIRQLPAWFVFPSTCAFNESCEDNPGFRELFEIRKNSLPGGVVKNWLTAPLMIMNLPNYLQGFIMFLRNKVLLSERDEEG